MILIYIKFHILMDWDLYKFIFSQDFVSLPSWVPLTRQQGKKGPLDVSTTRATLKPPDLASHSSLEDFFVPEVKVYHLPRGPKQGVPCSDPMEDLHHRALGQGDPVLLVDWSPRERGRSSQQRFSWFPTETVLIRGSRPLRGAIPRESESESE